MEGSWHFVNVYRPLVPRFLDFARDDNMGKSHFLLHIFIFFYLMYIVKKSLFFTQNCGKI